MKISSITLRHISMPVVAPFETSFGRETVEVVVSIGAQESASALVKTVESSLSQGYRRVTVSGMRRGEGTSVDEALKNLKMENDEVKV